MALKQAAREYYSPGQNVSCIATTAIVRETFVKITATRAAGENIRVGTCGAGQAAYGVALFDGAIGDLVNVRPLNVGGVVAVTAGAVIGFGAEIESNATGQAIPFATGKICGMAVASAAATDPTQVALGR